MILPFIGIVTFAKIALGVAFCCLLGIAGFELYKFFNDKVS